jgi:hypothetical protein
MTIEHFHHGPSRQGRGNGWSENYAVNDFIEGKVIRDESS